MDTSENRKHLKESFFICLSRMLERSSYYGIRSLIVLYMTSEILEMSNSEAILIWGWLTGSVIFSQILGALLGDLLIGNRRSVIIGSVLQALGAFSLCISTTTGLYIGLSALVLGTGFYTPNLISNFGKLYLDKTKLLDSGFTFFYLAVNIGSFLGILLIGYSGEIHGYHIGFIISGVLTLMAIIPVIFVKDVSLKKLNRNEQSISKRILTIAAAFIVVGLFWGIYEVSNIRVFDLQMKFREMSLSIIPKHLWQSVNAIFVIPISLIAAILWTYLYSSQSFKLMLGFILGVVSFGILLFIPEVPNNQHILVYLLSLFFLSVSEILIAPIVHSVLTKYANPKYLAILISLAFIPTRLMSLVFGLFNERFYDDPILALIFGIITMFLIGIGLLGYVFWNRKTVFDSSK